MTTRTSSTRRWTGGSPKPTPLCPPPPTRTASTTPTSAPSAGPPTASTTTASSPSCPTTAGSTATPQTASAKPSRKNSATSGSTTSAATHRTAGEYLTTEGGKVFDSGARTGVAVLIATKNPNTTGPCQISYHGVPDYQTQEDKLAGIDTATLNTVPWQTITPNQAGDWLNQRNDNFADYPAIGDKAKSAPSYATSPCTPAG